MADRITLSLHRASTRPGLYLHAQSLKYSSTSAAVERKTLLKKIYAKFQDLPKQSPEWLRLAESGSCWKDFHKPEDLGPWLGAQKQLSDTLSEIDEHKRLAGLEQQEENLSRSSLLVESAHQSCFIEANPLRLQDAMDISARLDELSPHLRTQCLQDLTVFELSSRELPEAQRLLPGHDGDEEEKSHIAELRNSIVVSRWISANAEESNLERNKGEGIGLQEIQDMAALMIQDTASERLHSSGWGERIRPGQFRRIPIRVKSNPLRVFPYAEEIPALMDGWVQWRRDIHQEKILHPLVMACKLCAYFVHIHPFMDGNGRASRAIMHDYMTRQGYNLPVVLQNLERNEYLRMISDAEDGLLLEFVRRVVSAQLSTYKAVYSKN